jgi:hypothetical protein
MNILAKLDFFKGKWVFVKDVASFDSADLEIGFCLNDGPVDKFVNLEFGFSVSDKNGFQFSESFPPEGTVYIATDQTYLSVSRIPLEPAKKFFLSVWASNDGQTFSDETIFETPELNEIQLFLNPNVNYLGG